MSRTGSNTALASVIPIASGKRCRYICIVLSCGTLFLSEEHLPRNEGTRRGITHPARRACLARSMSCARSRLFSGFSMRLHRETSPSVLKHPSHWLFSRSSRQIEMQGDRMSCPVAASVAMSIRFARTALSREACSSWLFEMQAMPAKPESRRCWGRTPSNATRSPAMNRISSSTPALWSTRNKGSAVEFSELSRRFSDSSSGDECPG